MDFKSKIVLIYGPTASGKSTFAVQLAKKINGEIINADSMQVYKELRILSARPIKKNYGNIKHHLYGFISGKKSFSTGDWLKLVKLKIYEIKKKKKIPILVGGTGLNFKSLTDGLVNIPNIPSYFRLEVRSLYEKTGSKNFFAKLIKIDPLVKKRIKSSDKQRLIRAFEVKSFTKKSIFNWFKETRSFYERKDFFKIYLDFPRKELIKRIELRSADMIEKGAISEVKKFLKMRVPSDKSINKAIGIKEIKEYIDKKIQISDAIVKISIKTRQYAKRQTTWARGNMTDWNRLNPKALKKFLKKI